MDSHENADISTTRTSKAGLYSATYESQIIPVPTRELHAWTINLRTPAGIPVENARFEVTGGRPPITTRRRSLPLAI